MADFTAEVFQNEFLPDGGTDVHAIVRVTSTGASAAGSVGVADPNSAAEVILIDTSGSMGRRGVRRPARPPRPPSTEIVDGTLFAVVSGNGTAQIVYPYAHQGALAVMSSHTRAEAHRAVEGLRAKAAPRWAPGSRSPGRSSRPSRT